jgi:predicted nucleotidyltransferase
MEKDRDLLRVFNERKVKYLVVGGYAVSYFTEPRVTKDLDIFIDTSDENVQLCTPHWRNSARQSQE